MPAELEEEISKARGRSERLKRLSGYQKPDRVLEATELAKEQESSGQKVKILQSSFPSLERLLRGFHTGDLIILSGPTGHGKTTLAKTFTVDFAQNGQRSLWFSYEMPPREILQTIPGGTVDFYVPREMTSGILPWIEDRIVEGIAKFGTSVVFIDHLHFLVDLKALSKARNQSVLIGILLRNLKTIALNWNVTIFLIAHLRKLDLEEEMPDIDDLRDSSFVGQESDTVLLLWRKSKLRSRKEAREGVPKEWTNEATLSLVKNRRYGALGEITLNYDYRIERFAEKHDTF